MDFDNSYLQVVAQRAKLDRLWFKGLEFVPPVVDRLREDQVYFDLNGSSPLPDHQIHSSGWGINE